MNARELLLVSIPAFFPKLVNFHRFPSIQERNISFNFWSETRASFWDQRFAVPPEISFLILNLAGRTPAVDNAFNEVNDEGTDKLDHTDDTYEMEELSETEAFAPQIVRFAQEMGCVLGSCCEY